MKAFKKASEIHQHLQDLKSKGITIGLVPTMGALHRGHNSLVERSARENDVTVVSIFVNPVQFSNPDDLKKYPRNLEKDLQVLQGLGVHVVFTPDVYEMYNDMNTAEEKQKFDFGKLESMMEGKFRPGHFKGVALAVSRLFEILIPDNAYFGEKDYQQLLIIKELVRQENYTVKIVPCPTVREENGLAMSSRNELLSKEDREQAGVISKALFSILDLEGKISRDEAIAQAKKMIEQYNRMKVEYLEVFNKRIFAAINVGSVRLIDNIPL